MFNINKFLESLNDELKELKQLLDNTPLSQEKRANAIMHKIWMIEQILSDINGGKYNVD